MVNDSFKKQKIVFFGSSQRAVQVLEKLCLNGFIPHLLITTNSPEIDHWIQTSKIHINIVLKPKSIDLECINFIRSQMPDLGILVSYGKILPAILLDVFPKGILNIHPSLLPKYRGPSPEQYAIINGDKITGTTVMLLAKRMDGGPILHQKKLNITDKETLLSLSEKLFELGSKMLIEILPQWIYGKIKPTPQDEAEATYTKLFKKEDGKINWGQSAKEIERRIRGLNPWPGTFFETEGSSPQSNNIVKILKGDVVPNSPAPLMIGTLFETSDGFPAIVCGQDALKLVLVKPAGKNEMSGKAYLLGHKKLIK